MTDEKPPGLEANVESEPEMEEEERKSGDEQQRLEAAQQRAQHFSREDLLNIRAAMPQSGSSLQPQQQQQEQLQRHSNCKRCAIWSCACTLCSRTRMTL